MSSSSVSAFESNGKLLASVEVSASLELGLDIACDSWGEEGAEEGADVDIRSVYSSCAKIVFGTDLTCRVGFVRRNKECAEEDRRNGPQEECGLPSLGACNTSVIAVASRIVLKRASYGVRSTPAAVRVVDGST